MACRSIRASTSIGSAAWDSSGPTKATARGNSRWRCLPITSAIRSRALALTEVFMRGVVAELDNAWRLTGDEIDAALREHGARPFLMSDVETERGCAYCRPMLADVPALFRFLGDPQAMRFTHCRRIVAGLPPSDRGARVVPSPRRLCPLDSRPQVRWPNHRVGWSVQRPVRPRLGRRGRLPLRSGEPGGKGTPRNWLRPAWTSPIATGYPGTRAFAHPGMTARVASCRRRTSGRSALSRIWTVSSSGVRRGGQGGRRMRAGAAT